MNDKPPVDIESMLQGFIPNLRGRRPAANLPTIYNNNGQPLPKYVAEKALGIRRENGAVKLKRLTHRHIRILGMHLQGMSLEQISFEIGCTVSTISRILNDPLAQTILKRVYSDREGEIQALAGQAVQVVREALKGDHSIGVKLRGVDRFVKIREAMLSKDKGPETAEDVIARMLSGGGIVAQNVQINVGAKDASSD